MHLDPEGRYVEGEKKDVLEGAAESIETGCNDALHEADEPCIKSDFEDISKPPRKAEDPEALVMLISRNAVSKITSRLSLYTFQVLSSFASLLFLESLASMIQTRGTQTLYRTDFTVQGYASLRNIFANLLPVVQLLE